MKSSLPGLLAVLLPVVNTHAASVIKFAAPTYETNEIDLNLLRISPACTPPPSSANVVSVVLEVAVGTADESDYTAFTGDGLLHVEMTSDRTAWTPLGIVTNTTGTVSITDTSAADRPQRFYRAIRTD